MLSVTFAGLAYGGVLCLLFPWLLTTPDARPLYPLPIVRLLIHAFLVAGFGLGVLSVLLRRHRTLGLTGIALAVAAALVGGADTPVGAMRETPAYLGLDWFLLNLLLLALVFVPLERAFPRLAAQPIFRAGWQTDLGYFAVSHLMVQVTVLLTMAPATLLFAWAARPALQAAIAGQPLVVQFVEIVLVADLAEYAVHRLFHRVPFLWRFHRIHHSAEAMDWLAGSRLHLVDIVLTRGLSFVPLYVLGFAPPALYAYLVFVSFHAVFIHANVRFRLRAIEWLVVTPRFHHWHHAMEAAAVDKNFAVHLPWIDRLFGTAYLPGGRWPDAYGVAGPPVPDGWFRQLVLPFGTPEAS
ncbi:MAG TPA: sterol desaturase family protein [Candidatus Binatia bacterium]|nr:sterol desaturase family protein [Candidatus Binatia bacterium]